MNDRRWHPTIRDLYWFHQRSAATIERHGTVAQAEQERHGTAEQAYAEVYGGVWKSQRKRRP